LVGCSSKNRSSSDFIKDTFQTHGAEMIRYYEKDLKELLIEFIIKLQKRNPAIFDESITKATIEDIKKSTSSIKLMKEDNFAPYIDYFDIAFAKKSVKNRGNYLVIGLYRMLSEAYDMGNSYKVTALSYNTKKLENLYRMLQVLAWKIRTKRDENGAYLFLTWQNNWQIELEKRIKEGKEVTWKLLESLEYIKNKRETLLSKCNTSFAMIYAKMIYIIKKSVEIRGGEPTTLSINTLKTLVFLPL
jgi:hypothetical protein